VVRDGGGRGSKGGGGRAKEGVGDGEIEQTVAGRAGGLVQFRQMLAEPAISVRIVEVARQVTHPVGEPLPSGLVEFVEMKPAIVRDKFFYGVGEVRAPLRSSHAG